MTDRYLCSERTLYRILAANQEVRERRDQLRHPVYQKPELLATAPNQVWSWDITKLLGPVKWTYYYLYVLLDIFSRYVPGWLLATQESAALAKQLIAETCRRQAIDPGQLTAHSDRGPSMTSTSVALLLADLGVTKSLSRPQTSNDNPYSEAQFKTLKYRPEFPDRFGSLQDGRGFCRTFFRLVQYRASPLGHRHADPGGRPLRPGPADHRRAAADLGHGVRAAPGTIRPQPAPASGRASPGLDQSAEAETGAPGCPRIDDRHRRPTSEVRLSP